MTKQEFIELRQRLETFAEKAGKEVSSDKNIQILAEGCIWIGANWMARALGVKVNEKEERANDGLISSNGRIKF